MFIKVKLHGVRTRRNNTDISLFSSLLVSSRLSPKCFIKLGDSRKYPYHTMDGFSEFRGQGGFFELEFRRLGGILTSGILKAWGGGGGGGG